MKKRIISVCLTALVLMSNALAVFAADAPTVEVDQTGFKVEVKVITAEKATKAVTAYIRSKDTSDKTLYGIQDTKKYTMKNGNFIYTLNFTMLKEVKSGDYVVYANSGTAATKELLYASPVDQVKYYNSLDKAPAVVPEDAPADTKSINEILTAKDNAIFAYRLDEYTALNAKVRALVDAEMEDWDLEATIDDPTADNYIDKVVESFQTSMDEVLARAMLASSAEVKADPKEEAEAEKLFNEAVANAVKEGKFDALYYNTLDADSKKMVRTLISPDTLTGIADEEIATRFSEAVLLTVYNTQNYLTFQKAYDYYAGEKIVTALDADKLAKLEEANIASEPFHTLKLETPSFDNVKDLEEAVIGAIDDAVEGLGGEEEEEEEEETTGSRPTGNRPTGSRPGGTTMGSTTETEQPEKPKPEVSFNDLGTVAWAETAILELAKKGVVSGRGDGNFYPNEIVTREEFVKMMVLAFDGYDENAVCNFVDVDESRWSYSYIASGYSLGLISGVDETHFDPAGAITREQMAVILIRAYEKTGKTAVASALTFADTNKISGYAKDAVAKLYGLGIVNGMGDNTFAPKATVTRAQAAKAIYETIIKAEVN